MRNLVATFWIAGTTAFVSPPRKAPTASWTSKHDLSKPSKNEFTSLFAQKYDEVCDVLVLGSGPGARSLAALLSKDGDLDVIVADENFDRTWVPNYGVWKDEWETILERYTAAGIKFEGGNAGRCCNREWQVTDCYFGGSFDIPNEKRTRLDRPYLQVDKRALAAALNTGDYKILRANHISEAIGVNMYKPAGSLVHDEDGTTIQLASKKMDTTVSVRAKIVVDATGHETKLILREARNNIGPPGFQIAYGALVDLDEASPTDSTHLGPYDKEAMTLFDYRTDHFNGGDDLVKATTAPTFMYAMPIKGNQVFVEETSLVARPAMSFQECKDRCVKRLEYHGLKVSNVYEEEFCYIPMGGSLPIPDQRVLAFAGASSMVHPSTGYTICRTLMGATDVARTIKKGLSSDKPDMNRAVAAAYHSMWSPENIRQRNFSVFGGEFLMKLDVVGLRGFFDGFFKLDLGLWGGFLAGWPGLAHNENHESWLKRMWFGLNFIVKIPLPVAIPMAAYILQYTLTENLDLMQSVTPFLGTPNSYDYKRNTDRIGDVVSSDPNHNNSFSGTVELRPSSHFLLLFTGRQDRSSQNDRRGRGNDSCGFC
jgi:lycopene beta-cyclase